MIPLLTTILSFLGSFLGFFKKYPWQTLFVLALVAMFFMDTCRKPCPEPDPCAELDTLALFNTWKVKYKDTTYIPTHTTDTLTTTDTVSTEVIIEIPTNIDSLAVAMAFYTKFVVVDTVLDDSNGLVIIIDLLHMNRIWQRTVKKEFYPTIVHIKETTHIKPTPKNILYLGFGVNGWENKFGVSGKVALQNKRGRIYILAFDPINTTLEASILFPLRFKNNTH